MVVLDTSALSAIMHRDADALGRLERLRPSAVVVSSPVAAEVHFGLARLPRGSKRRRMLSDEYRGLRASTRWADWTESAAELFGEVKAALWEKGEPIDDLDVAIASIALDIGASVATRNVRHFERVEGLAVDDWSGDRSGP